jgi:dTDP-4-amino-4,6-dideoxygalactose transaminase
LIFNTSISGIDNFVSLCLNFNNLKKLPIRLPVGSDNKTLNAFHIFVIRFKNKLTRNKIYEFLLNRGIKCGFHYIPIYKQPFYQNKFKGKCIEAEKYYTIIE